jgi:hypothetical protein
MINWKNKYLEAKLKYINAKNKLKQKGGVGDNLYIVQHGNVNQVLSKEEIRPSSSTSKYRPEINLDIINYHTTDNVAKLMAFWINTYEHRIAQIKIRLAKRNIQVSEAQEKDLFNILEKIYEESMLNPNGIWVVSRGDTDGPVEIDGVVIEAPFTSLEQIDAQPNLAALCKDCDTQFNSRNQLFKHFKNNNCPDC